MTASRTAAWLLFLRLAGALGLHAATPDLPASRPWNDYRVILWIGDSASKHPNRFPVLLDRLREMGVNAGMVHQDAAADPWIRAAFPYYVENVINKGLCLKWNSKVRDWDRFVTGWARGGRPESAFIRDYSLDDPTWQEWARAEARRIGSRHAPHQPLAYNLRDELSTTISANPFDYDYSPATLEGFRVWLRNLYANLPALNRQWDTRFESWDEVVPFSTDRIKNRQASGEALPRGQPDWQAVQSLRFNPATARRDRVRWNFSPWCDFRTYMDLSLARTLSDLRATLRAVDPLTPVGVEGTQMPHAFGGYDLWRLSGALDWVEPYDIGNAREIFGSFMPGRPILSTVFETDTQAARRRLWHLLLEGDRGCIIWWSEDCLDWSREDLALTAKGRALAPALRELTSPLARLFLRAQRERDPVFLHYSQASIQVNWLLESTADGSTWPRRFSSFEADHNRMAKVRNAWLKALQDLGLSPQFVASDQLPALASGPPPAAIVLPQSSALSQPEIDALQRLRRATTTLLFDGLAGQFDEHGRFREEPVLEAEVARTMSLTEVRALGTTNSMLPAWTNDLVQWPVARLKSEPNAGFWIWLEQTGLRRLAPVLVPPHERVRIHRFRLGNARLLAFERNIDYHMSEDLKQSGGNENLEKPGAITAQWADDATPPHLYDLRTLTYLGQVRSWTFPLDPWQPSLFALLPNRIEPQALLGQLERALADSP